MSSKDILFPCLLLLFLVGHQIADAIRTDCSYCIANEDAAATLVQGKMDFVCGKRPEYCGYVQPGGPCYVPNNLRTTASYVFNRWYVGGDECDFDGAEMLTKVNPSHGQCNFDCRHL